MSPLVIQRISTDNHVPTDSQFLTWSLPLFKSQIGEQEVTVRIVDIEEMTDINQASRQKKTIQPTSYHFHLNHPLKH